MFDLALLISKRESVHVRFSYYIIAFFIIIINIFTYKTNKNNTNERIISELKIYLKDNNLDLIDSVNQKNR